MVSLLFKLYLKAFRFSAWFVSNPFTIRAPILSLSFGENQETQKEKGQMGTTQEYSGPLWFGGTGNAGV